MPTQSCPRRRGQRTPNGSNRRPGRTGTDEFRHAPPVRDQPHRRETAAPRPASWRQETVAGTELPRVIRGDGGDARAFPQDPGFHPSVQAIGYGVLDAPAWRRRLGVAAVVVVHPRVLIVHGERYAEPAAPTWPDCVHRELCGREVDEVIPLLAQDTVTGSTQRTKGAEAQRPSPGTRPQQRPSARTRCTGTSPGRPDSSHGSAGARPAPAARQELPPGTLARAGRAGPDERGACPARSSREVGRNDQNSVLQRQARRCASWAADGDECRAFTASSRNPSDCGRGFEDAAHARDERDWIVWCMAHPPPSTRSRAPRIGVPQNGSPHDNACPNFMEAPRASQKMG